MKYVLSFFCFMILQACSPTYRYDLAGNSESDNVEATTGRPCYEKVLIPDLIAPETHQYLRYTGDEPDQEGIRTLTMTTQEASTKWVKKKADRNCLSANPEDCLVWCLVEVPGVSFTFHKVIDTVSIKDYVLDNYDFEYLDAKGGLTERVEVVCESSITVTLVQELQRSLSLRKYLEGIYIQGDIDAVTREALESFQRDNSLPVGYLDFETLDVLGVKY